MEVPTTRPRSELYAAYSLSYNESIRAAATPTDIRCSSDTPNEVPALALGMEELIRSLERLEYSGGRLHRITFNRECTTTAWVGDQ